MFSSSPKNRLSVLLTVVVLPLYLVLSSSYLVCEFHHPGEANPVHHAHHHSGQQTGSNPASDSSNPFCKYAQTFSPVIFNSDLKQWVAIEQAEIAYTRLLSLSSREVRDAIYLRGPPPLLTAS